ncbi:acyltransferase [Streptacidiphilus pinicola]|uniref:Acyltransferase n=1 Tax=Streptacidiphilus pinicola TaxID=2219663 RepID=A0A2X0IDA1_9ACTN|nr:acyltransferase [Streptacidiphilus pinicola]RAG81593.1 acyltransferase [Streptacidiphilus pinicola]
MDAVNEARTPVKAEQKSSVHASSAASPPRLGWLDALRGIAALCVVFQHVAPVMLWQPYRLEHPRLDLGMLGVFLFFLISGYIVPASLERRGDIRAFWVGRIFRLYPPFLVVVAVAALLPVASAAVDSHVYRQWQDGVGGLLMLPDLLGLHGALRVAWTLTYEMVFYYLVTALFALRLHRASGPIAVALTAVGVLAGSSLPLGFLLAQAGDVRLLAAAAALVVLAALACCLSGNRTATRIGAGLLGGLALTLVFLNGRTAGFETMAILATMFSGTAIYRAEQGQISRTQVLLCCGLVFVGSLVAGAQQGGRYLGLLWTDSAGSWCAGFAVAWALFGLGWLLRRRTFPRSLVWLGAVSYAVYLLHVPLVSCFRWAFAAGRWQPDSPYQELLCSAVFLAVLLGVSHLVHQLVELPAQKLGRRLTPTRRPD